MMTHSAYTWIQDLEHQLDVAPNMFNNQPTGLFRFFVL